LRGNGLAGGDIPKSDPARIEKPLPFRVRGVEPLTIVREWFADWRARCDRAQLALEVIGLRYETQDALEREGEAIKRVMLAISPDKSEADK
jgi:hypothetical protein